MILVIAEKPSVSGSLSKVIGATSRKNGYFEGGGYLVSWCLGHLAEYVEPNAYDKKYERWHYEDLPIIPDTWRLAVAEAKKEQFKVLSDLLNRSDLEYIVNACDAGREGESIFRRVYALAGSKAPVKRLWISSMENASIRDGFAHLKDSSDYDHLFQAAECRAKADWLVGMNATRAFTTKYYKRLVIGRVQTPTLAMLVERQHKMDDFVREPYYKVSLSSDGLTVASDPIKEETEANHLVQNCQGKPATVTKLEKTKKTTKSPRLYDLTTLQREANRVFGYTAQDTLNTLQELYEEKLVTYPRTDSQYITEDMAGTVQGLLTDLPKIVPFLSEIAIGDQVSRLVNNAKVTDHHAILPTQEATKTDLSSLSEKQKNIFNLVGQRLAQAVSPDCIYEETAVEVLCEGAVFKAKGKVVLEPGYQAIEDAFRSYYNKVKETDEKADIPASLTEGMELGSVQARKSQHFTSPPKAYTEDTLLSAMETAGNKKFDADTEKKGLGTPATRASIIEKLVNSGYAVRKGKQIIPTKDGMELIGVIPDYLKSAALTAEWENRLLAIERGEVSADDFIQGICNLLTMVLNGCDSIPEAERQRFDARVSIGNCPLCGKPVYESVKNSYCSDKSCRFALWKENRFLANMRKTIDKKMAADLLKTGKTHVTDLYSAKKDGTFAADLVMKIENERPAFTLSFPKTNNGKKGKAMSKKK